MLVLITPKLTLCGSRTRNSRAYVRTQARSLTTDVTIINNAEKVSAGEVIVRLNLLMVSWYNIQRIRAIGDGNTLRRKRDVCGTHIITMAKVL